MAASNNAEKILETISSQIDLLTTLSVGICAGIVALLIQIAIHNHADGSAKLRLRWGDLLFLAFFCEGASLVLGYLSYGALTDAAPIVLGLVLDSTKTFAQHEFPNAGLIRGLALTQFLLFFVGILAVFVCLLRNRKLLI